MFRNKKEHLLVLEALLGDDVFLALGRVEVNGQLNSLGLVNSQWDV